MALSPLDALRVLPVPRDAPLAVAVSGGCDSMALMHALVQVERPPARVLTVDHQLRPDSADDARFVVQAAHALGLRARVLAAPPVAGQGPEDAARRSRYAALRRAADELGARVVLLAHTADDQAETILMRLRDGAGLAGMGGMPAAREEAFSGRG